MGNNNNKLTLFAIFAFVVGIAALADGAAVSGYADAAMLTRVAYLARVAAIPLQHLQNHKQPFYYHNFRKQNIHIRPQQRITFI